MSSDSLGCSLDMMGPYTQMTARPCVAIGHHKAEGMQWKHSSWLSNKCSQSELFLKGRLLELANLVMALVLCKAQIMSPKTKNRSLYHLQ